MKRRCRWKIGIPLAAAALVLAAVSVLRPTNAVHSESGAASAASASGSYADGQTPEAAGDAPGTVSGKASDPAETGGTRQGGASDPAEDGDMRLEKSADRFEGIEPDRFGPAGLLLIPAAGINVRLFDGSDLSNASNQKGVDLEDSAALINFGGADVIGDHTNQGFSAISSCVPGETRAYIVQEDHTYREYRCLRMLEGTNEEYHLYGNDGLDYMHAVSDQYDLVMYTCLEDWRHIEIVLWEAL